MPTLNSHTHCQAAHSQWTDLSLSKSVSIPTLVRKEKTRKPNNPLRDTFHTQDHYLQAKKHFD